MSLRVLFAALAIAPLACPPENASAVGSRSETGAASASLDRLRSLAGEWEGEFEWTGARSGRGTMTVHYALTARGTAVMETLLGDGVPLMMSVYHEDGADLRITHYCGSDNQPRFQATQLDPDGGRFSFEMVDITNLASPEAGHVGAIELGIGDDDTLTIDFTYVEGDETSREHISLRRAR